MTIGIHHLGTISPDRQGIADKLYDVEEWTIAIPPETEGFQDDYRQTFWLGCTEDGRFWFLAAARDELEPTRDAVVAVSHPEIRDVGYLSALMFRALAVVQNEHTLSKEAADRILAEVAAPIYRLGADFLPELPGDWLLLPCELVVGFKLSEGAHVSGATFKQYRRDTLLDALRVLKGGRHDGILIRYLLKSRNVVPFLFWDVDSPLARKSKTPSIERKKVQGSLPWEAEAETTLLEVYQHIKADDPWAIGPPYFGEAAIWLRVGGRTPEEAKKNWDRCAKALRSLTTIS